MAKKKAAKSTKSAKGRSSGRASKKAPKLEATRSVVPDEAARPVGEMSDVEIGHVAGTVWDLLTRHDGLTLVALKKEIAAPPDMVMAAIGWLAREDKLEFSSAGRGVKISLR